MLTSSRHHCLPVVQISANPGKYGKMYRLTSASSVVSSSGKVIRVYVGFDDYAAIKLITGLATSLDTTYLSYPQ